MTDENNLLMFFLLVIWIPVGFVILLYILYIPIKYLISRTNILKKGRRALQYKEVTVEEGNMDGRDGSVVQDLDEAPDTERLSLMHMEPECQHSEQNIGFESTSVKLHELENSKDVPSDFAAERDKSLRNPDDEAADVTDVSGGVQQKTTTDDKHLTDQKNNTLELNKDREGSKSEARCKGAANAKILITNNDIHTGKTPAMTVSGKDTSPERSQNEYDKGEGSVAVVTHKDGGETASTDINTKEEGGTDKEEDPNRGCKGVKVTETSHKKKRSPADTPCESVLKANLHSKGTDNRESEASRPGLSSSRDLTISQNGVLRDQPEDKTFSEGTEKCLKRLSPECKQEDTNEKSYKEEDDCKQDLGNLGVLSECAVATNLLCEKDDLNLGVEENVSLVSSKNKGARDSETPTKSAETPPKRPQEPPQLPETPPKPPRKNPKSMGIKSKSLDDNPGYPFKPSPLLLRKRGASEYSSDSKPPPLPASLPRDTRYKNSTRKPNFGNGSPKPRAGRYTDTAPIGMASVQEESVEETGGRQGRPNDISLEPHPPRKPKRKPTKPLRSPPPNAPPPAPPVLKSPSLGSSKPPLPISPPPRRTPKPHSGTTSDEYENAACAPLPSSRPSSRKGSTRAVKPTSPPPQPPPHLFYATRDVAGSLPTALSKNSPNIDGRTANKYSHKKLVRQEAMAVNQDVILSSRANLRKLDFGPVEEEFVNPIYQSSDDQDSPPMNISRKARKMGTSSGGQQPASSSEYNEQYITAVAATSDPQS